MKSAIVAALVFAVVMQPAFACGDKDSTRVRTNRFVRVPVVDYPRKDVREGLIRKSGWHPLWMQETPNWRDQATMWDSVERYYLAEVADLNGPGDRFLLPDTAELYSSVESMPRLKDWATLLSAYRIVRYKANGKVFAYGLYVTDDDTPRCGRNDRRKHDTGWWNRKHGNNYCEELRPVKPSKHDEEAPPPVTSAAGASGCIGVPMKYRWDVYPSWRPSIIISDQDGDGIFERLDVMGKPPLPEWAKTFARLNKKIEVDGLGMDKKTPLLTPELLAPRVTVVLASH